MKSPRPSSLLVFVVGVACSAGPARTPKPDPNTVDVAIASVTLADDCGGGPTTAPPIAVAPQAQAAEQASAQKISAGASLSQAKRACEQSSVQLRVTNGTAAPSAIAIQKVELLDESGAAIADLAARAPSRWSDDTYQAWDERVAPSETLQVSYALSAPLVQRGATYTVRITIATGDGERTIEQRATLEAEASLPPGVVT